MTYADAGRSALGRTGWNNLSAGENVNGECVHEIIFRARTMDENFCRKLIDEYYRDPAEEGPRGISRTEVECLLALLSAEKARYEGQQIWHIMPKLEKRLARILGSCPLPEPFAQSAAMQKMQDLYLSYNGACRPAANRTYYDKLAAGYPLLPRLPASGTTAYKLECHKIITPPDVKNKPVSVMAPKSIRTFERAHDGPRKEDIPLNVVLNSYIQEHPDLLEFKSTAVSRIKCEKLLRVVGEERVRQMGVEDFTREAAAAITAMKLLDNPDESPDSAATVRDAAALASAVSEYLGVKFSLGLAGEILNRARDNQAYFQKEYGQTADPELKDWLAGRIAHQQRIIDRFTAKGGFLNPLRAQDSTVADDFPLEYAHYLLSHGLGPDSDNMLTNGIENYRQSKKCWETLYAFMGHLVPGSGLPLAKGLSAAFSVGRRYLEKGQLESYSPEVVRLGQAVQAELTQQTITMLLGTVLKVSVVNDDLALASRQEALNELITQETDFYLSTKDLTIQ